MEKERNEKGRNGKGKRGSRISFGADPKFSLSEKIQKCRLTRKVVMVRIASIWEQ